MSFNVLGSNHDGHWKNFGFLMDAGGAWAPSPAFDLTYAFNPGPGKWTAAQQMSVAGKREHITIADLLETGDRCLVATRPKLKSVIEQVVSALEGWPESAQRAGVGARQIERIARVIYPV